MRECTKEQKPAYLYHSAGPCKSLFPIRRILSAERLARHDAFHDLWRAVADLQSHHVAPALLQRRVHVVAVMAVQNDTGMNRLGRDLRPQLITVSQACVVSAVTNDDVLSMAANIEAYGLLPRDAIHVAVAQRLGIDSIVSDDDAFDRVPGITLYKPEPGP